MIPSLREYFLFFQDEYQVERFVRGDDGIWQILGPVNGMDQVVPIASASCEVQLADVYDLLGFETGG